MATNIKPLHDRVILKRIEEGEQVRGGIGGSIDVAELGLAPISFDELPFVMSSSATGIGYCSQIRS